MGVEPDEKELVRRAQAGDRHAYRLLVEKYQQRAFHIAFEILRHKEDAEDVVQESFVKAFLSLSEFRGQAAFYTWLYRIVYNMAIDFRRKVSRRNSTTVEFRDEGAAREGEAPTEPSETAFRNPQELLLEREQLRVVEKVLATLSEEHRIVLVLRELDGLSYEEIAESLGVPKGTVMSRLHYARKRLQEEFSIRFGERQPPAGEADAQPAGRPTVRLGRA